jgi:glycosyltransferase involved in cell wall biosynthesis
MSGQRKALIVANDEYEQEGLRHLLAPAADAEALAQVLGDRNAARAMGLAGRRRAEEIFSTERAVSLVEDVYRTVT